MPSCSAIAPRDHQPELPSLLLLVLSVLLCAVPSQAATATAAQRMTERISSPSHVAVRLLLFMGSESCTAHECLLTQLFRQLILYPSISSCVFLSSCAFLSSCGSLLPFGSLSSNVDENLLCIASDSSYSHSLSLVLVVLMKSKELETKIYSHADSLILSHPISMSPHHQPVCRGWHQCWHHLSLHLPLTACASHSMCLSLHCASGDGISAGSSISKKAGSGTDSNASKAAGSSTSSNEIKGADSSTSSNEI